MLSGLSALGTALAPTLLSTHPLALVMLNPTWRHLLLVAPVVDVLPMMAVALPRLVAVDPFMYVLGRDHGDQAIAALTGQMGPGGAAYVHRVDAVMRRASWLAMLLWPAPLVCALAGAARMPVPVFATLSVVSRVGFLLLLRWSGAQLAGPLGTLRAFVDRHASAATVVSIALLLAFGLRAMMQSKATEPE